MSILEVRGITKRRENFSLSLSFSVEEGEILSVIGPSGAGKSTLLSVLSGEEAPDSGSVVLRGRDITHEKMQKRNIGMIFQDFSLFPSMSVEKNILYGVKHKSAAERKALSESLLSKTGLKGYGPRSVTTLSGGEAQRVALARAMAAKPDILLLDEPLSALDIPMRRRLRDLIKDINRTEGITMIYVTHDIDEAFSLSDRILIINEGRCAALGRAEELYANPPDLFTAFFTGDGAALPAESAGEKGGGMLFFRTESVIVSDGEKAGCDARDALVLEGAEVAASEYEGARYRLELNYKGRIIPAYSNAKPESPRVSLIIPRDAVRRLTV